jgi:hypothetical protein
MLVDMIPADVAKAATDLTVAFNAGLNLVIKSLPADVEVAVLEVFRKVEELIASRVHSGLLKSKTPVSCRTCHPLDAKNPINTYFGTACIQQRRSMRSLLKKQRRCSATKDLKLRLQPVAFTGFSARLRSLQS